MKFQISFIYLKGHAFLIGNSVIKESLFYVVINIFLKNEFDCCGVTKMTKCARMFLFSERHGDYFSDFIHGTERNA